MVTKNLAPFTFFGFDSSYISFAISLLVEEANKSPCFKSKRGVIALSSTGRLPIVGGFNSPPKPFVCAQNMACRESCAKVCIHAEERVLGRIPKMWGGAFEWKDVHLLHIKVQEGEPVVSGPPSCVLCSKKILEYDVGGIWLFHSTGWTFYSSLEFHMETLRNLKLPTQTEHQAASMDL